MKNEVVNVISILYCKARLSVENVKKLSFFFFFEKRLFIYFNQLISLENYRHGCRNALQTPHVCKKRSPDARSYGICCNKVRKKATWLYWRSIPPSLAWTVGKPCSSAKSGNGCNTIVAPLFELTVMPPHLRVLTVADSDARCPNPFASAKTRVCMDSLSCNRTFVLTFDRRSSPGHPPSIRWTYFNGLECRKNEKWDRGASKNTS